MPRSSMACLTTVPIDATFECQLVQHGHHQVGRVDLEVGAQGVAGIGAPESIRAERAIGPVDEAGHLVGYGAHVVGDGDNRIGS